MELNISEDFTMEDIRKIRDYDYEMTKDMTPERRCAYYNEGAQSVIEEIERIRRERVTVNSNNE